MEAKIRNSEFLQGGETGKISLRIGDAAKRPESPICSAQTEPSTPVFRLFEYAQPLSFAERFPRLTCIAIACSLLATALIVEIDCLRGSGYYWR